MFASAMRCTVNCDHMSVLTRLYTSITGESTKMWMWARRSEYSRLKNITDGFPIQMWVWPRGWSDPEVFSSQMLSSEFSVDEKCWYSPKTWLSESIRCFSSSVGSDRYGRCIGLSRPCWNAKTSLLVSDRTPGKPRSFSGWRCIGKLFPNPACTAHSWSWLSECTSWSVDPPRPSPSSWSMFSTSMTFSCADWAFSRPPLRNSSSCLRKSAAAAIWRASILDMTLASSVLYSDEDTPKSSAVNIGSITGTWIGRRFLDLPMSRVVTGRCMCIDKVFTATVWCRSFRIASRLKKSKSPPALWIWAPPSISSDTSTSVASSIWSIRSESVLSRIGRTCRPLPIDGHLIAWPCGVKMKASVDGPAMVEVNSEPLTVISKGVPCTKM